MLQNKHTVVPKLFLWIVALAHIVIVLLNFNLWLSHWTDNELYYEYQMSCWGLIRSYKRVRVLTNNARETKTQISRYAILLWVGLDSVYINSLRCNKKPSITLIIQFGVSEETLIFNKMDKYYFIWILVELLKARPNRSDRVQYIFSWVSVILSIISVILGIIALV